MNVASRQITPAGCLQVVPIEAIRAAITPERAIAAVRAGLVAYAAGRVRQALTSHLDFHDAGRLAGECHVKWGHDAPSSLFVIKVATGFYGNPRHGLPSSNGLMLLMSARTGAPVALLEDGGWLTNARTAAAGALAVEAAGVDRVATLGIVGTGTQAAMQARWISTHVPVGRVLVWGREGYAAERLTSDLCSAYLNAATGASIADLTAESDVIVTTTPATEPILMNGDVRDGTVIVAVGADALGKRELEPSLLRRAERIICDDPDQCLDQGELQGVEMDPDRLERLGHLLSLPSSARPSRANGVTIIDLTGIATQDVAVAQACWAAISNMPAPSASA